MDDGATRRGFLLGGASLCLLPAACSKAEEEGPRASGEYLYPPGAESASAFLGKCIRCLRCAMVCPVGAISGLKRASLNEIDLPVIYPREVACVLCMKCALACPTGALLPIKDLAELRARRLTMGTARIDEERCLKIKGLCTCKLCSRINIKCVCRLCYDVCPLREEAITLAPKTMRPKILDGCIGCGLCAQFCPDNAILIERPPEDRRSKKMVAV